MVYEILLFLVLSGTLKAYSCYLTAAITDLHESQIQAFETEFFYALEEVFHSIPYTPCNS